VRGSVSISFPVFSRYSRKAASKRLWKFKNDVFGWEVEEDIELVGSEEEERTGSAVLWAEEKGTQRVVHGAYSQCTARPRLATGTARASLGYQRLLCGPRPRPNNVRIQR
jgi:hypothetical protein